MIKRDLDSIILTRQELAIMKVVWGLGTASVKDVCRALSQSKPTAYTTVLTLMGILEEKGVLLHVRNGRAFLYRSLLSRNEATRNQIRDLIARFFDGRPERLIASVLETEAIAPEQLGALADRIKPGEAHQVA
jgi:predicted transcriptional regulator